MFENVRFLPLLSISLCEKRLQFHPCPNVCRSASRKLPKYIELSKISTCIDFKFLPASGEF